MGSFGHIQ